MEFALEYKVKQSKNGKFSLLQASPTVHKPFRIQAPPKISPSKRAFEKYKPGGLFSEFYGILLGGVLLIAKTISVEQNKRKFRHPPPPNRKQKKKQTLRKQNEKLHQPCSSLTSVQMIITLPDTSLRKASDLGKNTGTGFGREFKKFDQIHFAEGPCRQKRDNSSSIAK